MATLEAKTTTRASQKKAVLLISPVEQDHEILRDLFAEQNWTLFSTHSCGSASRLLRQEDVPVVMTERDLPLGDWRDVLEIMQFLPHRPLVIVMSLHADERLWADALNRGAYDVLTKPLDRTEIVRVLNLAWSHCKQATPSQAKSIQAPPQKAAGAI